MTRFLDGPAAGAVLMLRRAPTYLRAVQGPTGDWDALDQLTDEPGAAERIVVYRMERGPFRVHVNRWRQGCGWYQGGEYLAVAPQPDDAAVRTTHAWRAYVTAQVHEDGEAAGA